MTINPAAPAANQARQTPHSVVIEDRKRLTAVSYTHLARQLADGRATMALTSGVNNTEHLNTVIARLRKIKSSTTITRV